MDRVIQLLDGARADVRHLGPSAEFHGLAVHSAEEDRETRRSVAIRDGVEQTEIDALASLRPELLRQAAEHTFSLFYDHTLSSLVAAARTRWLTEAQQAIERATDAEQMQAVRDDAANQLENMR